MGKPSFFFCLSNSNEVRAKRKRGRANGSGIDRKIKTYRGRDRQINKDEEELGERERKIKISREAMVTKTGRPGNAQRGTKKEDLSLREEVSNRDKNR